MEILEGGKEKAFRFFLQFDDEKLASPVVFGIKLYVNLFSANVEANLALCPFKQFPYDLSPFGQVVVEILRSDFQNRHILGGKGTAQAVFFVLHQFQVIASVFLLTFQYKQNGFFCNRQFMENRETNADFVSLYLVFFGFATNEEKKAFFVKMP